MTLESEIQHSVLSLLRAEFPHAFIRKLPVSGMHVGGGRMVKSPLAGMPDVVLIHEGRFIGFECKAPGRKRTDQAHQGKIHDQLRAAGASVFVVSSVREVQSAIQELKGHPSDCGIY